ncbi:MAG: (d)CMP kinase [Muribaculaceae bacterium]|nr:(d)CMP kinase [Muribaculaceae bacterium]MDE7142623.1 (d)CMP kinase [Muribaculaceae bacterium]
MTDHKKIIIAIDGFSSSGKSTMAKALARRIGYRYVDTGAMYRAVTLFAMRAGLIAADGTVAADELAARLPEINISFALRPDGSQHTLLNGEDVEREIRGMEVSNRVSPVSAIAAVRRDLVAKQQAFGLERGIVMDGRDIGTTVFPDAELKIFLDAPAECRAERRVKELKAKGQDVSYDEVLANVKSRDHIDQTREESPLRRAADAIGLDNSSMTIAQQDEWLMERFNEALTKAGA